MEAGALAVGDNQSGYGRLKDATGRHPARSALVILAVLVLVMIASNGLHEVAQRGLNGLSLGAIYALGAVGLTLVYGILKLVNFAHGDFLTFGAYMAYLVNVTWGLPLVIGDLLGDGDDRPARAASSSKVMWGPMRAKQRRDPAADPDVDRARVRDPYGPSSGSGARRSG